MDLNAILPLNINRCVQVNKLRSGVHGILEMDTRNHVQDKFSTNNYKIGNYLVNNEFLLSYFCLAIPQDMLNWSKFSCSKGAAFPPPLDPILEEDNFKWTWSESLTTYSWTSWRNLPNKRLSHNEQQNTIIGKEGEHMKQANGTKNSYKKEPSQVG